MCCGWRDNLIGNGGNVGNGASHEVNQGLRLDFQLQPTHACTDVDVAEFAASAVEERRERLFHANGRAAAANVAGGGKQLLHGNEVALLVARSFGCLFEVDFGISGNNAYEMPGAVAVEHKSLEYLSDILIELFGDVVGGEVVLVDNVWHQFVFDFSPVEQTCCISLVNSRHDKPIIINYSAKIAKNFET